MRRESDANPRKPEQEILQMNLAKPQSTVMERLVTGPIYRLDELPYFLLNKQMEDCSQQQVQAMEDLAALSVALHSHMAILRTFPINSREVIGLIKNKPKEIGQTTDTPGERVTLNFSRTSQSPPPAERRSRSRPRSPSRPR